MKSILITGGTGSFGSKLVESLISNDNYNRIIVFSRDELKQHDMHSKIRDPLKKLRFFLGDIRDLDRLNIAFRGVDEVVHAAALKQVVAAEYNPFEFIKTNIIGSQNIIEASVNNNVKKVVALSTDKAASPANLYGATKLCADKLFVAANNMFGGSTIFSNVRYGNVAGSRGSIIPFLKALPAEAPVPLTDNRMTRFSITLDEGVSLVLDALHCCIGGEIIVPKLYSYRLIDLVKAMRPLSKIDFIGVRPGEKLHEEMISEADSLNTIEFENRYVILPTLVEQKKILVEHYNKECSNIVFSYSSDTNEKFFTNKQLNSMLDKLND